MTQFLQQLAIVMATSLVAVYALRRARLPPLVGFLFAGVLLGPGGLGLVHDRASIDTMANVGVVFLLFGIGLNFSFRDLQRLKGIVFGAGSLQVLLTAAAVVPLGLATGLGLETAIFLGLTAAQTSSTVMAKVFEERGEAAALYARFGFGVSIFQDLGVVPLMLLVPVLAHDAGSTFGEAARALGTSVGVVLLILASARYVFPWIIERIVRTRVREAFTIAIFLGVVATALLSAAAGLSLALGALLAGIVISESPYANQILSEIAPVRDALSGLFFVSVGMLVDPRGWAAEPAATVALVLLVVLLKAFVAGGVALLFGFGLRVAILAGVALAQVGEFAFLLADAGRRYGLVDAAIQQHVLTVSVLSMAAAPVLMALAPRLAGRAQRILWLERLLRGRKYAEPDRDSPLEDHVVIVGYGLNGRNVARVLARLGVRYAVVELNPHTVRALHEQGESAVYGDASREEVLRRVAIDRARVLVLTMAEPTLTRQAVSVARRVNPRLHIVVRTRFVAEVQDLYRLGANEVVPEEFETSLELASLVLERYGAPRRVIERERAAIREERYAVLLGEGVPRRRAANLGALLASADIEEVSVDARSPAVGSTLRALDLRGRTGASVIARTRDGETAGNPAPDEPIRAGDVLFLFGNRSQIESARALFAPPRVP
jgi:CPA2 family monovalent cation:H+ antiporter-2